MADVLIVDDREENRDFLMTLLGYQGHALRQASDGQEALEVVRAAPPDLVISDVLMPTMDGYEFVHRLRSDPRLASIPVIFCTAHYLEREATSLAEKSGVKYVLQKPCEPAEVLRVVAAALGGAPAPLEPSPAVEHLSEQHLRLLTDEISKKAEQLRLTTLRLSALMEICRKLGYERDPRRLVERYARAARDIIGAKSAGIRIEARGASPAQVANSGLDIAAGAEAPANLTVPLTTPSRTYGWLWLNGKLGGGEFQEEDTSLAMALAGQLAVAYENASLYEDLRRHFEARDQRLEIRKERVVEMNAAHTALVQAVSHELRAPIGRAGALMDMLRKRPGALSESGAKLAAEVARELDVLDSLLAELLELSRAETAKIALRPVDLSKVVEEVIDELRAQTRSRSIEWRAGKLPQVSGNRGLLKRALANLLGNAAKFTSGRKHAVIEIDEVEDGGRRAIRIRDNGVGFNGADAHRMFDAFERLHAGDEFPGTGLGLAIVKTIIERHGGAIRAESAPGKGATFWFTLGAEAAAGETAAHIDPIAADTRSVE